MSTIIGGGEWFAARVSSDADSHIDNVWRHHGAAYVAAMVARCRPIDSHDGHAHGVDA